MTAGSLVRPQISYFKTIVVVIAHLAAVVLLTVGFYYLYVAMNFDNVIFGLDEAAAKSYCSLCTWMFLVLMLMLCFVIKLRSIIIWLIRAYQRYAPVEIRLRCNYNPSCSEYTILALQKYGIIKAVPKCIDRYKRCRYPNGGVDYP